ncbi:glycosyltransferase [Chlorobaculum sp. 24CR]|uniref:glycosyltransferase n=1 Tax=Chlorobaculum sp. 24CR TaxID=2508878 RepID=UPI00100B0477|nr:glycosyltransferase [Chlorobaculum sp. 24CR]RXK85030.1 glycosyltransferase [Chlorobaculum sp. 24CR]
MNEKHLDSPAYRNGRDLPEIDCVLIGVNSAKTLGRCIESIRSGSYPPEKLRICYADGGSTDESIAVARRYDGVRVLALTPEYPTPGLGRNAGWRSGSAPLVQFLDSDTIVDPEWFGKAVGRMRDARFGAVIGFRRELHPERSIYNWIGDLEWNGPVGESDCFGGDVLLRREALETTGGYDETLVGGEDPELSRRVIRAGWKIERIDAVMTRHDLAMTTLKQYLKRAYRSGYGFAAVRAREARLGSPFWKADFRKIAIKGGGFIAAESLATVTLLSARPSVTSMLTATALCLAGVPLLFSPRLFKVGKFMQENQLSRKEAKIYAWHCSAVVLPQLAGVIRFHAGALLNRPLKNKKSALKTGLSNPAA